MALFQKSVLNKHLKLQNATAVDKAYKKFAKYFGDARRQQNIRDSKEEQFQEGFLRELFVNVFGYTLNPEPNFNLTSELKNEKNAKKTDGAILKDGQALAVIELKSTKTKDLESVRQQAFDYKANQTGCVYVITSNFEKIRFYINNAVDFEEFNLFTLTKAQFNLMYLCLESNNLLSNVPLTIKTDSVVAEENITKTFYKDYSQFKRELYRDLVKQNVKNEVFRSELQKEDDVRAKKNIKLALFKKSQKLIDRFLFVFFAEDRGLLPPNSTLKILEQWDSLNEMDAYTPLYNRYKKYFEYLDTGRKGTAKTAEIFAYNGGLFKPDAILDSITINDELLYKHTKILSDYDFDSQVDVNILGHIFENSLNEIESVNAEIEGGEFDNQKTKRKKDGVFYTPKYITKYIVDNTVGKLCEEKKVALNIITEEFHSKRQKVTKKKLLDTLHTYRDWLLQLTICDPACGSGAFLNQALDFLIKEHQYIDELETALMGGGLVFPNIENTVLENNIFGVDLNEESVEIAKLSLWLRTAQPRRKLNSLNNNIKCGNSLIDSKAIAGDKTFKWKDEFTSIFEKGGFDVVIGNPPYVRKQGLMEHYPEMCDFYEKTFKSATGNYDIYALFMEHSYSLINDNGTVSFILPHKFLISDFGVGIRNFFRENKAVENLIHFGSEIVFKEASTYTCIIDLTKKTKEVLRFNHLKPKELFDDTTCSAIPYYKLSDEQWILTNNKVSEVLDKINQQPFKLKDIFARFVQGIITGKDAVFCIKGEVKGQFLLITDEKGIHHKIEKGILKPHLRGEDVNKFKNLRNNEWLIFPYILIEGKAELITSRELENKYPNTLNYLKGFENILREREKGKFDNEYWYQYSRNQAISVLEQQKIITPEVCFGGSMTLDENNYYHNSKCHTLLLKENTGFTYKSILPLINSSLFWFYLTNTGNLLRGGYIGVKRKVLEPFPIPSPELVNVEKLEWFTDLMLEKKGQLQSISNQFTKYLTSQFSIEKLTKKLQNWHELEFADFIKELNKAIKKAGGEKLSKLDEMDWMEVFETKKEAAQKLKAEIDKTDKEIDSMVYDLYELTDAEIAIVEGA